MTTTTIGSRARVERCLPEKALAFALMLASVMCTAATSARADGAPAPPALAVTVSPPLSKHVSTWDEYWGQFQALARVEVRPRVSGFIEQVHFKDGSIVKAGDLLFTLDKRPFQIAVDSAEADVARQEAQVQFASDDVDRAEPLAKSKVMSDQVFDQRKSTLKTAQAQLLAYKAALESAKLNLEWSEVRAPIDGRISDKKVDAGNLVSGGQVGATLLATIVTLDPIHFVFDVSEADYLRYSRLFLAGERPSSRDVENPVRVKLSDEAEFTHAGKMDFVDNAMNERSGTMRGRAILDNKNGLLTPGVFARLQLFGGDIDAFLIPDSAVISDQARKIVFTVNADNVVTATPVVLGPMIDGLRVVRSGLDASHKVVIDGLANPMVRPGAKVTPQSGEIKAAQAAQN